jgi:hypothetical protein
MLCMHVLVPTGNQASKQEQQEQEQQQPDPKRHDALVVVRL